MVVDIKEIFFLDLHRKVTIVNNVFKVSIRKQEVSDLNIYKFTDYNVLLKYYKVLLTDHNVLLTDYNV